jgi:adenylate cyclase
MQEREKLMSLFSRHVAKQLASDIWEHRDQFLSGGHPRPQRLVATAFFSDVVAFSSVSEQVDPPTLMDWLSDYMSLMTPIINGHNGVILRFIGDAIMAVFGVPIPRETEAEMDQDAIHAVDCALAMQEALITHNRALAEKGMPLVAMRVGIFTGSMVAGSIGDVDRLEYNVHGDTVNTASRLEGYRKEEFRAEFFQSPCRIFIGQPTYERLGDRYVIERIGDARLRGKEQLTTVYRVIARCSDWREQPPRDAVTLHPPGHSA